jgi:membrane protease YdiL (CAAX protease family)
MPTTSELFEKLYPIVLLPYLLGPVISSILLTGLVDGKAGFRKLLSRLFKWRVNARWYAVALLTAPLLALTILFALSLISPAFLPNLFTTDDKLGLLLTGIAIGLIGGGLMEEPGWTGFALPRLRLQYGVFPTGLIIGFVWGVWHFLPTYWGSGDSSGVLSLSLLLPPCFFYIAVLPAFRVLMVWVYDHTESLLVVSLMHMSLTASTIFVLAPSVEGVQLFLYYLILATVLWGIVVAMKVASDKRQARIPPFR